MKYIFGPVVSRRLGVSLGLDLVPFKTCTLDCVYCECGRTTHKTIERKPYVSAEEILKELHEFLKTDHKLNYITLGGSGEPTLNSDIGLLIDGIKEMTETPVAVLTNGTLLYLQEVRHSLLHADLVIPSLDAVEKDVFINIDRPFDALQIDKIINGLIQFRKEFSNQIWLEIFFVKGINDHTDNLNNIVNVVREINPNKVQLNTVDRPPAESDAEAVDTDRLYSIYEIFRNNDIDAEIIKSITETDKFQDKNYRDLENQISNLIKRRPETMDHIAFFLGVRIAHINKVLQHMEKNKKIEKFMHQEKVYYRSN